MVGGGFFFYMTKLGWLYDVLGGWASCIACRAEAGKDLQALPKRA